MRHLMVVWLGVLLAVPVLAATFTRDGYDGGKSPLGLTVAWNGEANGTRMFLSSPVVAGGRVFAASCEMDLASTVGGVYCFDLTGQLIWKTETVAGRRCKGFFSSPAVTADGRYVLIGEGLHMDGNSRLICLDARTGAVRWAVSAPDNHFESSPAILDDMVVCGAGAIETDDGVPPDDPGFVLAVRISDGAVLWKAPVTDPESSPAIAADGTTYIGSGINGCAVVALRSGTDADLQAAGQPRVQWRTPVEHPATGTVTLAGDRLFIGIGRGDYVRQSSEPAGGVVCLDRLTGKVLWQRELGDVVLAPIAVRGGVLIAPVRDGNVVALRVSDGAVLWKRDVAGGQPVLAGVTVTDSHVYAVAANGVLAILSARDGKVVERLDLNPADTPATLNMSLSAPVIAGGRLFVGSECGGLCCLAGTK